MRRARRRGNSESGQDVVEFALILPVLVLLLLGIIEFGWLIFTYNTVAHAAREGARAGVPFLHGNAEICDAALGLSPGLNLVCRACDPNTCDSCIEPRISDADETVQVTVRYEHYFMTAPIVQALGGRGSVCLQSTATMRRG
jgi:TadE-like protein